MERHLQPELLDSLSPDDPAAKHSRRDLRIINRAMGNYGWMEGELRRLIRPGESVLEIGAGMGDLASRLNQAGIPADGLDLWPVPADWPASRTRHRSDLREFKGFDAYPVVIANLFLHQFTDSELAQVGRRISGKARLILASEPARKRRWQWVCALIGPFLGANYVTRHDAHVSIAAGFLGDELPRALGLDPGEWDIRCTQSAAGGYRMVAIRRA